MSPPRIAFLAYRGNMMSGGQGVYLHALTRELARLGHEIDVFVGPPYPDPMPWARVFEIENCEFWGARFKKQPGAFLPRPDPLRIFEPLNFYEYAVTRFGFLPEPFAFSVRAARAVLAGAPRGRSLRPGSRRAVGELRPAAAAAARAPRRHDHPPPADRRPSFEPDPGPHVQRVQGNAHLLPRSGPRRAWRAGWMR